MTKQEYTLSFRVVREGYRVNTTFGEIRPYGRYEMTLSHNGTKIAGEETFYFEDIENLFPDKETFNVIKLLRGLGHAMSGESQRFAQLEVSVLLEEIPKIEVIR